MVFDLVEVRGWDQLGVFRGRHQLHDDHWLDLGLYSYTLPYVVNLSRSILADGEGRYRLG
jgi:hypothetical protein